MNFVYISRVLCPDHPSQVKRSVVIANIQIERRPSQPKALWVCQVYCCWHEVTQSGLQHVLQHATQGYATEE